MPFVGMFGPLHGFNFRPCAKKNPPRVMIALPHSASDIHHHGAQDTVVYAKSGKGSIVYAGGKKRQDLSPGDFALIPAWAEHQEVNDGDEEVTWIIVRSGRSPVVENLQGWGESQKGSERTLG
jgi:uncharacterized RmlC-like cupin family protein